MLPIKDIITQDMATITKVCLMDIENLIFLVGRFTARQQTRLTAIGITNGRII
jgi:hypothetical protein